MTAKGYIAIRGSQRDPLHGANRSRACDRAELVQLTVVLRPRPLGRNVKPLDELIAGGECVTRSELRTRYGADPKDVKRVEEFARANRLNVSDVNLSART